MIHYKTVEVPATTKRVEDKTTCDFCGKDIKDPGTYEVDEIEIKRQIVERITVSRRVGENYPSGGSIESFSFDMCPDCWTNKFLPWAKEQRGAVPAVTDCSY